MIVRDCDNVKHAISLDCSIVVGLVYTNILQTYYVETHLEKVASLRDRAEIKGMLITYECALIS